jgi:phage-related protein (TIGR01555 family)
MPNWLQRVFGAKDSPAPTTPAPSGPRDIADALENDRSGLGTSRDKRFYSQYSFAAALTDYQLENMFQGSWLARGIVSTPAEDMTREWVTPKWDALDEKDLASVRRSERRLGLKPKTRESLTWCRLYGGCTVVANIDGQDPKDPLDLKTVTKGRLKNLWVFDKTQIFPTGTTIGGMPEFYRLREAQTTIHASRLVRFEGSMTPYLARVRNNYWHDSELQHVFTALRDFDGAAENVAAMFYEAKIDVIKTALTKLLDKKAEGKAALELRYQEALLGKGVHKTLFIDKGEEYAQKTIAFGGIHDVLEDFVVFACGAAKIPMVKLFGQSAPGMNSTGDTDLRLYYDHVAAEAEWQMMPPLEKLYEIIMRDALGVMPEGFELCANPLWQISAKDQATIDYQRAQADQIYKNIGAASPRLIARENKKRGTLYTTMDDADVEAASDEVKETAPVAPAPGGTSGGPDPEPDPTSPTNDPAAPKKGAKPPAET